MGFFLNFGKSCNNSCGHCVNSSICDHITGVCFGGCGPGYKEPTCDPGNTSCNMIAKDNTIVKLYHSLYFLYTKQHFVRIHIAECDNNMYGENCSNQCGKCPAEEQCDHIYGACTNGCISGYDGQNCIDRKAHLFIRNS